MRHRACVHACTRAQLDQIKRDTGCLRRGALHIACHDHPVLYGAVDVDQYAHFLVCVGAGRCLHRFLACTIHVKTLCSRRKLPPRVKAPAQSHHALHPDFRLARSGVLLANPMGAVAERAGPSTRSTTRKIAPLPCAFLSCHHKHGGPAQNRDPNSQAWVSWPATPCTRSGPR